MIAMRQIAGHLALGLAAVTLTLTGTAGPAAAQLDPNGQNNMAQLN